MRSHHTVSCLFITGMTGNHHSAPVHPYPHVLSRYKERITVVAELVPVLPVNPDPLAHCNPACKINVTVTPFRMGAECLLCLFKQDLDSFPGNLFCHRAAGSFLHGLVLFLDNCALLSACGIKKERWVYSFLWYTGGNRVTGSGRVFPRFPAGLHRTT
jgi:hypothetical protein